MKIVKVDGTFSDWREKARMLLAENIHYDDVQWTETDDGFIFGEAWTGNNLVSTFRVSREFVELSQVVSAFRDISTWFLLYRSLYRLKENPILLADPLDPDVLELHRRYKLVTRDIHKMKAFVRFKEITEENGSHFMAWHRPDHRIVKLAAPFFKDRFNGMKWTIMTEDETMSWDLHALTFGPGIKKEDAPLSDDKEELWKTYYKAIFNPARIKISAMKKELPVRHWKTLPETELITSLIQEAPDRLETFYESQRENSLSKISASTIHELNEQLKNCKACGICEKATAPVPGHGPHHARIMVIGEQPGHEEDLAGTPFIGPSGKLLDEALQLSHNRREDMYLTNAVKGFKYIPKGHTRWHKGASITEIKTCNSWLKKEVEIIKPEIVVCLGRSAALSAIGKMVKIEDTRGKVFETPFSKTTIILPHPASILRDQNNPEEAFQRFTEEWKIVSTMQQKISERDKFKTYEKEI